MIRILQTGGRWVFVRIEAAFTAVFGEHWNPWFQLGALSFYFFWVIVATGIYLFVFFNTSIIGAFESVERLSNVQWLSLIHISEPTRPY